MMLLIFCFNYDSVTNKHSRHDKMILYGPTPEPLPRLTAHQRQVVWSFRLGLFLRLRRQAVGLEGNLFAR